MLPKKEKDRLARWIVRGLGHLSKEEFKIVTEYARLLLSSGRPSIWSGPYGIQMARELEAYMATCKMSRKQTKEAIKNLSKTLWQHRLKKLKKRPKDLAGALRKAKMASRSLEKWAAERAQARKRMAATGTIMGVFLNLPRLVKER